MDTGEKPMCVLPIKNEPGSKWIKCGDVKKKLTGEQIFEPCYIFNIEHLTKFFNKCSVFEPCYYACSTYCTCVMYHMSCTCSMCYSCIYMCGREALLVVQYITVATCTYCTCHVQYVKLHVVCITTL